MLRFLTSSGTPNLVLKNPIAKMADLISSLKRPFGRFESKEQGKVSVSSGSVDEKEFAPQVGQQDNAENAAGGLGRHLGVFSTMAIMRVTLMDAFRTFG